MAGVNEIKTELKFNHYGQFPMKLMLFSRMPACWAEGGGFEARMARPRIFSIFFHQQKLSSLSIACNIKLEGAL